MLEISSSIAEHIPTSLQTALQVGRGGGAVVLAAAAASSLANKNANSTSKAGEGTEASFFSPQGKSVLFMAIAMALHYLGYSLARPITVSLFTSAATGYTSAAAFPFAMAFVSPASLLLLMGYNSILERSGPRGALMQSTAFCAMFVNAAAVAIAACLQEDWTVAGIPAVKFVTGPLFVFRESYVQLLTSQYWSFMASALTPNQSSKWFGPIAGLTSITSAVAGVAVSPLVSRIGLTGALLGTGIMLILSLFAANVSYNIARDHGFEPKDTTMHKKPSPANGANAPDTHKMGMLPKARRLFARVPVLQALFMEILASQGLATVLNVIFVTSLGAAIPNDDERAGFVGKFYSLVNVITMCLQFAVLPPLMTILEPKALWRVIPLVSLMFSVFQSLQPNPSLYICSASLLVMKVSEYSARRMLDEMIFVPLDFESRFVGKEVIGVFGYRFGKSLMSLVVSGFTSLNKNIGLQGLSVLSTVVSMSWMQTAWRLSNMVPTRAEAEAAFMKDKERKVSNRRKPK
jgi:ATP/ADP translocase